MPGLQPVAARPFVASCTQLPPAKRRDRPYDARLANTVLARRTMFDLATWKRVTMTRGLEGDV